MGDLIKSKAKVFYDFGGLRGTPRTMSTSVLNNVQSQPAQYDDFLNGTIWSPSDSEMYDSNGWWDEFWETTLDPQSFLYPGTYTGFQGYSNGFSDTPAAAEMGYAMYHVDISDMEYTGRAYAVSNHGYAAFQKNPFDSNPNIDYDVEDWKGQAYLLADDAWEYYTPPDQLGLGYGSQDGTVDHRLVILKGTVFGANPYMPTYSPISRNFAEDPRFTLTDELTIPGSAAFWNEVTEVENRQGTSFGFYWYPLTSRVKRMNWSDGSLFVPLHNDRPTVWMDAISHMAQGQYMEGPPGAPFRENTPTWYLLTDQGGWKINQL